MRLARLAPAAQIASVVLCIARVAHGEEVSARLVWRRAPGAESCIDAASLENAVNTRWQRQVFVEAPTADLVVDGKIGPSGRNAWTASIEMRRADGQSLGTRELVTHSASCSALDEPIALALGIMLDVSRKRVEEERAASAASAPEASELVSGPSISIPEKPPAPPALGKEQLVGRRWHVEPFAAAEGFVGILPGFDLGGRFGFSITPPEGIRAELSASLYPAKDASSARPTARLDAWAAELAVYPFAFSRGVLRTDVGAGVRLVQVHADGLGLDQNGNADEVIIGLGLRAGLGLRVVGPLEIVAGLGGDVSLLRYRFVYLTAARGRAAVHETGPISAEMFVGLGLWL
jgi:hypothetical protein